MVEQSDLEKEVRPAESGDSVRVVRLKTNTAVNEAIEKTMQSLTELSVSSPHDGGGAGDADEENQNNVQRLLTVERVKTFHDYCTPAPPPQQTQDTFLEDAVDSTEEVERFGENDSMVVNFDPDDVGESDEAVSHDEQWKALWDEHYQEQYWHYYSMYQEYIPTAEGWVHRAEVEARLPGEWESVQSRESVFRPNDAKAQNFLALDDDLQKEESDDNVDTNFEEASNLSEAGNVSVFDPNLDESGCTATSAPNAPTSQSDIASEDNFSLITEADEQVSVALQDGELPTINEDQSLAEEQAIECDASQGEEPTDAGKKRKRSTKASNKCECSQFSVAEILMNSCDFVVTVFDN